MTSPTAVVVFAGLLIAVAGLFLASLPLVALGATVVLSAGALEATPVLSR